MAPDGKAIYVLYATALGKRGLRIYSADLQTLKADIEVPDAKVLARPRNDADNVYVLTVPDTSASQRIAKVSILHKTVIQEFAAGASGLGASALDLAPDETTIYLLGHEVPGDSSTRLAQLSLISGQYALLGSTSVGANVTELQALDMNRILMANNNPGTGPGVFDLRTGSTVSLLEDNAGPLSFPYAFSPDGRTIYAMYNQLYEGGSYFSLCQFGLLVDGKYDGDDLEMTAYEVGQGVLDRPFAIVNLD